MLKRAVRPLYALPVSKTGLSPIQYMVLLLFLALFVFVLIRSAWLNDDAYITFRTVDNFVNGYGLTWNINERVQAYTHPLWLFLLSAVYVVSRDLYHTAIWLSILLSVATLLVLVFGLARHAAAALLGIFLLTLSKAFVDYSTSGLENALTHFLLALFLLVYLRAERQPATIFVLSLLAALGLLNRLDTALFYLPALAYVFWQGRSRRAALAVIVGFLPLIAWECFSLLYYGFLLPNTAYAKAGNLGIQQVVIWQQSLLYFQNSLRWDPLTLATIVCGLIATILSGRRQLYPLAAGIVLYLLYIIHIGGDFMSGRFFSAPFFVATALLVQLDFLWTKRTAVWVAAVLLVLVLGLSGKHPAIFYGGEYGSLPEHQENWIAGDIADERMYYYPFTGLLNPTRQSHPWALQGAELRANGPSTIEHGNIGFLGFYAGPAVHIIDRNGLADPLLARLPVRDPQNWRIGHFRRHVPEGYTLTRATGINQIQQPELAQLYDRLALVTEGNWRSWARLIEIWNLNTGKYRLS